jgi:hypothetical protein
MDILRGFWGQLRTHKRLLVFMYGLILVLFLFLGCFHPSYLR